MIATPLSDICSRALAAARDAGARDAEAFAAGRKTREVVYEKNDLNLARTDEELSIGIRVLVGKSFGFATTNDPGSLVQTARQAVAMARVSPADDFNGLPEPASLDPSTDADRFNSSLVELGASELAPLTCEVVAGIAARDSRIAVDQVRLQVEEIGEAIGSSKGVAASARATYYSGFVMGMARQDGRVGSLTYDGAAGHDRAEVEAELWCSVDRFIANALGALSARKGRTFKGVILLTPEAVGEILAEPLLEAISADAVRKGRSPLGRRLGERIAAPSFTLRDAGPRLGSFGTRYFDREGQPVRAMDLVRQGDLASLLYDAYEARVAGREPTGHARGGAGSLPRPGSGLVEILPGMQSALEIERSLGLALLVPRFAGRVEVATGDFSGVVKGGFLIENGERIPVSESMISGNLYDVLCQISAVSSDRRQIFGSTCFPTIAVDGVAVTAG